MMTRRRFGQAGAGAAWTAASWNRIKGANDRLNMALIGSGRRGREVMKAFLDQGLADLRGLCDVYDVQRQRAKDALRTSQGTLWECVAHEEALSHRDLDAVLIATADHWHLPIATAALQAGKHVYLEKPATHQLQEGAPLLRAARTSGKVCQVGTQQRSGAHYRQAKEQFFDSGKLGKVLFVRAFWSNFPWQARRITATPQPAGLDWDRFQGPAKHRPYEAARYDSWRSFPEYGGGVLADILNHWADVAQWMMDDAIPLNAVALGGIYQLQDGRVNPDSVSAVVQYGKGWNLVFESSVLPIPQDRPSVVFVGTEGTLDIARTGFVFQPRQGQPVTVDAPGSLEAAHTRNFVESIRTGTKPSADVELGLQGVLPCHLARTAYWTRKRARYDAGRNEIVPE